VVACWNYDKYAVFGLNSCSLSSAGNLSSIPGVVGDVAVGGGNGILQKTTVNGRLFVDSSAQPDIRSFWTVTGGSFSNQNLSQDEADVLALSAQIAALPSTQTFGDITNATTIARTAALNVIRVNSINLTKKTLTLVGNATDTFLINVTSPTALFVLNGVQVILSGGLTPNHVVFNFPGPGGTVHVYKQNTGLNGTLLAPSVPLSTPIAGLRYSGFIARRLTKKARYLTKKRPRFFQRGLFANQAEEKGQPI
jgi:hypothetical protein